MTSSQHWQTAVYTVADLQTCRPGRGSLVFPLLLQLRVVMRMIHIYVSTYCTILPSYIVYCVHGHSWVLPV